jgi:hypothetical protein
MASFLDFLFFFIIILLLFSYSYISQFKKIETNRRDNNDELFDTKIVEDTEEDGTEDIKKYESDKYQDLYGDLPWDDFDEKCEQDIDKIMNSQDFISTVGLRKPKMVIW